MKFPSPLTEGTLLKRYKRFLADVAFEDGQVETVHCPNPGAMMGVADTGARCFVSRSPNKNRKLPLTLELVECEAPSGPTLTGINTGLPNKLAEEAIRAGSIEGLSPEGLKREVKYGTERSRVDILLAPEGGPQTFVEVKNCHLLRREDGVAEFPDCVTARGLKHLRELSARVAAGDRAVLLFIIQREDATGFAPAADLDPAYAQGFAEAQAAGVEMLAYRCRVSPQEVAVTSRVPIRSA